MTESNPLIKAPEAWEIVGGRTSAGQGVRVAVIDSGIEPKHVMFSGRNFEAPTDLPDDDYCSQQPAFCNDKVIVTRYYPPSDIDQLVADEIEEATPARSRRPRNARRGYGRGQPYLQQQRSADVRRCARSLPNVLQGFIRRRRRWL